ncbi:hypothetical protein LOTGIDRAFT_228915 [Lottia gigantea]|uniref:Uncharacterized protein n=1 Tax=Lottia gigantea TaxID=225164 RepID=V4A6R6_LOTGI|nr:hypothetical protein LOTGIDRAFT_228915 [Lottia gigantea]ESO88951.1 hypothetical protein LOTGIDRAFT_228915 [Lottia gigantea]
MKFTQYLQSREIGFLPNKSKFKSKLSAETLIEKQSVQTIKNLPCKLSGQTRATFLVDFSNDRSKVASTHGDHTVRVSDIVSGKCTHVLVGHPRTPWCLAFHPSSNDILASGCLGGEVRIWDLLGGGSEIWHAPNGTVIASLTFHPTDHVLLFATANSVYFWDWSQPEPFAICQTNYEYERVRWLGFDPLGHYIYTGITNVTTIHRDDPPVIHIRDRTGHHPNSRLRSNWPRYQHLVERFHSYQRGRTRNRFDEMEEDGADIPPRPLSPVHIDGINLARQFAAEVTATSQSSRDRSRLRSAQQPVPINYLWDINEDGMEARPSFSRDPESPSGRQNNTDEDLGSSDITLPSPLRQYFTDPRTRDWSPPPRVSNDEVDSFVDDEIERFRSVLRQPESRFRSRYATRPSHQSRTDRSQRRLAIFSEFMRRRGRNPDGSRMNNNSSSTRSRGYLFERGLDRLDRSSVTNTNSNEFTPRLIDRLNENIDLSPSSSATSTSSTTTLPSIFSTVPRVSTGFPPARITGLSQNHFGSRFSSNSTPETATAASLSSDNSSRSTLSIAQALTTSIQNSLLGRSSEDADLETESTSSNLVVQRQSDESNSLDLPSTATSSQSLNSSTFTVTSSSNSTLFVDQPLAAPRGNTEENSCSRTRPPYRGLDRGGLPSSISRLRRQLADCRTSRQRMLRHSRLQLSRTPQPESFRNPLNPRPTELPVSSHSRNQHLSRFLTSTISNSLFSPNLDVTTSSTSDLTPRPSVLQRHWSPPGDTRTILTDQTSQTAGTMTEPEYTDQGTDVVGLNLDVELTHEDESMGVDDASEDTSYLLYDSDTITDSSLTIDLSDEAAPTDHEDLHIPIATENFLNSLDSSHDIITLENLSYRNEDAELEPVTSLDESPVSTSTTSILSGLNDSSSATSDLASVSSLCQFVNHYNQSSPINITSSLTDTLNTSTTMTAEPSDALDSNSVQLVSTSSITVTPDGEVSNTVVVSSTPENDQGLEENAASIADSASVTSNASVSNNSGGSPPSLPDDDSTNNCPAHTVLRHHAYLANATARLERRISELDQRIGRSNSAISSSSLNNREDLASITARLERQVSELDHRINALRQSFTERLRALHQDRDRILSMRGRLSGEPERAVPTTTSPSALPRITITRAGDESNDDADLTFQPTTGTQAESRRNGRTLLESFLRYESSASQNNTSNTNRRLRNPSEPPVNRGSEDESWHSLQQIHLHPHYSSSILDDTINRPNDALQAAINRAIAGAFMGTGESAVANNIVPQSHRIQWWDFTQYQVPDLKNSKSNIVVPVCKLHNDASCDISQDGTRLATFVPSHRGFPDDNILAVFSLQTHNFSHCLFTKSFGPNAISVSISPRNDHVLIGLAAKRLSWVFTTHQLVGQIYHLKEPHAGEESMKHVTDVFHTCDSDVRTHVSVNSARWLPRVGEGIVYGTNRGDLVICRPSAKTVTQKAEVSEASTTSAIESENSETLTETRMNLLNLFQTTTPQTSTAATQTISRGIRRTAGTQTSASTSQDDGFREPFIV